MKIILNVINGNAAGLYCSSHVLMLGHDKNFTDHFKRLLLLRTINANLTTNKGGKTEKGERKKHNSNKDKTNNIT